MTYPKKLPDSIESPIDIHIYNSMEGIVPHLNEISWMSPNVITTFGLIFGLLSIFFYIKGKWKLSILFMLIYYYFDCMDGYYARKYDKISEFGDYYDHFRDWFIGLTMIILIFLRLESTSSRVILISSTLILLGLCALYVGCEEQLGKKYGLVAPGMSNSLKWSEKICPNPEKTVKFSKYFGPSSFVIFLCIYIWYSNK